VEEVLSWYHYKNLLCQIHLIPHCWWLLTYMTSISHVVGLQRMHVYRESMNFINNISLLHCQQKGWLLAKMSFSVVHWLQDIRLMLPSEVSHSSGKLTPWNQSLCPLYSPMVQWHSYTMGTPLVVPKPNPFCTVGLTSCGTFGPTMLLLPTPHTQVV